MEEGVFGGYFDSKVEAPFYDAKMKCSYESAVDYVNMHYSYCQRKGKFWDYVRSKYQKSSMQEMMEGYIQDPNVRTPQTGKVGSFFDGTNWHVWLLQLMTTEINPKEYWKKDETALPRYENFLNNVLPDNQANSVIQSEYINHIDSLV